MGRSVPDPDPLLFADEAAALAGISRSSWKAYRDVRRQRANPVPEPDHVVVEGGHARPQWRESTVRAWMARRPGRGARSDLRRSGGSPGRGVDT